jgi:hypothetical protein
VVAKNQGQDCIASRILKEECFRIQGMQTTFIIFTFNKNCTK